MAIEHDHKVAPPDGQYDPTNMSGRVAEQSDFEKADPTSVGEAEAGNDDLRAQVYGENDYTEEDYKKVKRKIDTILLPLMWWAYGIQMTDKVGLSNMNLFGLQADTGMRKDQFGLLSTVFYVAYAIFEFPSNWLMQRWHVGRSLTIYMIIWGIVVLVQGFLNTWAEFMALRFLQGAFECTISPGFNFIIASWYLTREHSSRSLVFQSANSGYGIVVDMVTYGIAKSLEGDGHYFRPWRGIVVFLGAQTLVAAVLAWYILGTPAEVKWLNQRERSIAYARIASNNTGTDETGTSGVDWQQVRDTFKDPVYYFQIFNTMLASVCNGAITTFGTVIFRSFGFDSYEVLLYGTPRYAFCMLWFFVMGVTTTKYKNIRMYWMIASTIVPFAALLTIALLPPDDAYRWARYAMYCIGGYIFSLPQFAAWTLISSNVAGRSKFSVMSASVFVAYCVGNLIGSQTMRANDAPRYIKGTIAIAACMGIECFVIIAWRMWYVRVNKKKAQWIAEQGISEAEVTRRAQELALKDTTDVKNPYFVYTM